MLNKAQEKVVYTKAPFLFLLAGAGTGKTSVIVARIKYLIDHGVSPHAILAITFTNKAANEMSDRIKDKNVSIHTFHQFCFKSLKAHVEYNYHMATDDFPVNEESRLMISRYKNSLYQNKEPKNYKKYEAYLKENSLKDFDDLLIDFHHYFHKIKTHIDFEYIFIDEFQDTNILQYKIIKKIINKNTKILCVGDPDQSIYKFRGANDKIIHLFISDFNAKVYKMTTNYRSSKKIISVANGLIKVNIRRYTKELKAINHNVYEQYILENHDQLSEAKRLIKMIKKFINDGVKISDIAVLYRNHNRAYLLKETLAKTPVFYHDFYPDMGLNLLSLHQAKGLEFSVVFIIGLEQGSLPSYHTKTNAELQEERRLFFVGITRAKHYLYLSYVRFNNDAEHVRKSIFLKELKRELPTLVNYV